jgi:hypothetical protein
MNVRHIKLSVHHRTMLELGEEPHQVAVPRFSTTHHHYQLWAIENSGDVEGAKE